MREILFRGKTYDGKWEQGDLRHGGYVHNDSETYIMRADVALHNIPVDTKTVGQYTGLTDKNGRKIFEGDIVKMHFEGTSREYDGDFSEHCYDVDFDGYKIGVVTFGGYGTFLKISHGELYEDGEKVEDWKPARRSRLAAYRSEVIGNIHDNPELMGGNENERNNP